MQVRCHVASMSVKLPAEALAWSLTLGKQGLSGLPQHQTPARCGFTEGWSMYPPYPIGVPQGILLERLEPGGNGLTRFTATSPKV